MRWTDKKIKFLEREYSSDKDLSEIGKILKKSAKSIKHKAARLGLSRKKIPSNKPKEIDYRRKIEKKYYERNKERIYENKVGRLKSRKEEFVRLLGGKCGKCGYGKCIAALDFHHKGGNKEGHVAHLIKNFSKEKALKEIKKCILVCANCHRELHYKGSIV